MAIGVFGRAFGNSLGGKSKAAGSYALVTWLMKFWGLEHAGKKYLGCEFPYSGAENKSTEFILPNDFER